MNTLIDKTFEFLTTKRFMSLYWRAGTMLAVEGGDMVLQSLTEWNSSSILTIAAGLVLGEITKKLNSKK